MWSPQKYKKEGLKIGRNENLLENAIVQSNKVIYSPNELPSILSLNHLAKRTKVSYKFLRAIVDRGSPDHYKKFSIRKRSGGRRFIHVPTPKLLHVQRWLNKYILKNVPAHTASHAFRPGSSIKLCASKHCGARWLIKFDITDFFESISEIQVFRVFKSLGYQPLVAFELSRLCTLSTPWKSPRRFHHHWLARKENKKIPSYSENILGYLPQGAATSPLISNLVMIECDKRLDEIARKYALTYTRYSDDLTFSTRSRSFSRCNAKSIVFEVYKVLSKSGYRPQYRKTKVISPGSKKIVLGLNVDGEVPRLQKEFKDKIRQHLYYIEKYGLSIHVSNRDFDSLWGFKCHLKGMIDHAHMIEPEYGQIALRKFSEIEWPV